MKLPFSINPELRANLSDQLTDGIREAIQSGRYRPGDRLPGTRAVAKALGISVRAPTEAFRRLADEGLLTVRTKAGAVVRERGAKAWKGRVLLVLPDGEFNYFQNVFYPSYDGLPDEIYNQQENRQTAEDFIPFGIFFRFSAG